MNPEARDITIEIKVNSKEKARASARAKELGIGLSTWYRSLGNEALEHQHRKPAALPGESRGCPGPGHVASRNKVVRGAVSGRRAW